MQHFPSPQFFPPGLQQIPSIITSPCRQHCPPTSTSPKRQHKLLAAFAQWRFVPKTGPDSGNGFTGSQQIPPQTSPGRQHCPFIHTSSSCGQHLSPHTARSGQHVPRINPLAMHVCPPLQHCFPAHACWSCRQHWPLLARHVSCPKQQLGGCSGKLPAPHVLGQQAPENSQAAMTEAAAVVAAAVQAMQPRPKDHQQVPATQATSAAITPTMASTLQLSQEPVS